VERYVIAALLKPGGAVAAERALLAGPPFDPAEAGLSAHAAYSERRQRLPRLRGGGRPREALQLSRQHLVAVSRWQSIISGSPSGVDDVPPNARCLYLWTPKASA
jgi:hypothetical protein